MRASVPARVASMQVRSPLRISSGESATKLFTSRESHAQPCLDGLSDEFAKSPWHASVVRSTARARSPQRKGRCVQVKPLLSRRARDAASALSGVQSAEWREQGHKRTPRNPQEHHWSAADDSDSACQNRFCSSSILEAQTRQLTAYPPPRIAINTCERCATKPSIAAAALRRNRDASSTLC